MAPSGVGLRLQLESHPVLGSVIAMDETQDTIEVVEQPAALELPSEPVPPIHSRFLFVDVAALRAKQLRRGARLRFAADPGLQNPVKLERLAMEEVKRGLVPYTVTPPKATRTDEQA